VSSNFSTALHTSLGTNHIPIDPSSPQFGQSINAHIQNKVGELVRAKAYDTELANTIVATLCGQSFDSLQWVTVACETLRNEEAWYVEKVLQEIAACATLDLLYAYLLENIKSLRRDDGKFCLHILSLMVIGNQSLKVSELESYMEGVITHKIDLPHIISKCGCFLVVNDGVVSFRHKSARDYLANHLERDVGYYHSHSSLVQRGVKCLVKALSDKDKSKAVGRFALLQWLEDLYQMVRQDVASLEHGKRYEPDSNVSQFVALFLETDLVTWLQGVGKAGQWPRAVILLHRLDVLFAVSVVLMQTFAFPRQQLTGGRRCTPTKNTILAPTFETPTASCAFTLLRLLPVELPSAMHFCTAPQNTSKDQRLYRRRSPSSNIPLPWRKYGVPTSDR